MLSWALCLLRAIYQFPEYVYKEYRRRVVDELFTQSLLLRRLNVLAAKSFYSSTAKIHWCSFPEAQPSASSVSLSTVCVQGE